MHISIDRLSVLISLIWCQVKTFVQVVFRLAWKLVCTDRNSVLVLLRTRLIYLAIVAVKCLFYTKAEFRLALNFQLLDSKFSVSPSDLGIEFPSDFFVTIRFMSDKKGLLICNSKY